MEIRPILSTLLRHKTAAGLIVLEIALSCAIICNALFVVGSRVEQMQRVSGIAEAARWDDVANTLRVGGYGTVDARVSWRFAPGWTLQANLVNAFDRDYQTSAWYAQPGREWALSLRWQPD